MRVLRSERTCSATATLKGSIRNLGLLVSNRDRFQLSLLESTEKHRVYGERYPIDEEFLAALAQMPPASGGALGFDRLVMLAAGVPSVADVQWTPLTLP